MTSVRHPLGRAPGQAAFPGGERAASMPAAKRPMFRILACILAVLLCTPIVAATPRGPHPYLIFNDADVARLKARVDGGDPLAGARWVAVRAHADELITKPAPARSGPGGLEDLALAYRMTRDTRYARAARDAMLRQLERPTWVRDQAVLKRDPPWISDLGTGFVTASFGIAYDAVYDALTPAERRTLSSGLIRLGIDPIRHDWLDGTTRLHTLDTMGHNWWGHIVFGGGIAALALMDDDHRARIWADEFDDAAVEWFRFAGTRFGTKPRTWGDDGANSESINYANLGLHSLLLFRRAWVAGVSQPPSPILNLERTADFFLQAAYPRKGGAVSLNFGDGSQHMCGCQAVADLWTLGARRAEYAWYLAQFAGSPEHDAWSDPVNLPFLPTPAKAEAAGKAPGLPVNVAFKSQGWAMMRTSWDPDATLLAIKSGFTWNHNHADEGSFLLHQRGENLLIDSGNVGYALPEYDGYYRQSRAHNVVTIDGQAEPPASLYEGSQLPGVIDHMIAAEGFRYLWTDQTGPTSWLFSRNYRSFIWVGGVILVIDDLKAYRPGQFEWLLHYDGEAKRNGQTLRIAKGAAAVDVRPLFPKPFPDAGLPTDYPEDMRLVEHQGLKDHDSSSVLPYVGFQPQGIADRTKFVVAIVPEQPGSPAPVIERIEAQDFEGVRITQNGKVTEVYLNLLADGHIRHRNALATLGGFQTDAYILAVTRPVGSAQSQWPESFFVADGSFVRRGGQVLMSSLSKTFLHARRDAQRWTVELDAQPNLSLTLVCPSGVMAVAANGLATSRCEAGSARLVRREISNR